MRELLQHDPPDYLAQKLGARGKSSFREICAALCPKHEENGSLPCRDLAYGLDLLSLKHVDLSNGMRMDLCSLDSYDSALGEFTLDDLRRIESEVRSLIETINKLKRTPLVRELNMRHMIPSDDVLGRSDFPCDPHFQGLLNLRNSATGLLGNPRKSKKYDFDSKLKKVYQLIHAHTNRWYDEQVADILGDLFPEREEPFTQSRLKQWRYEHGLTGRK